jgi:hypothetical protein
VARPPVASAVENDKMLVGECRLLGPKRTYRDVCYLSAFGGKADISQQLPDDYEYTP